MDGGGRWPKYVLSLVN